MKTNHLHQIRGLLHAPPALLAILALLILTSCKPKNATELRIEGLNQSVEVLRDPWGINHIYAKNEHDLFFAQGYLAAQDRLFQFEIWRRQATGTVAEILGERALKRDIGTRLFMFRGDMDAELNHYHPRGREIVSAYVEGVNRYIEEIMKEPSSLPVEFRLLKITPQPWTPEVVISRHQGLLGNITQELNTGIAVSRAGADMVQKLSWFHPRTPKLELDSALDGSLLKPEILELYRAFRTPVSFTDRDIDGSALADASNDLMFVDQDIEDPFSVGSNNWIIRPEKMENGHALMANDPHRTIAIPSLRYMVHLSAPGWDVIGGGEPEIPGVSIGHNEYGAWGLTVFRTDGEDLYVYDLNPEDLNQYRYQGTWESMTVINDTIPVKGMQPVPVTLKYTRHGPVCYTDTAHLKAYAVRCAWLEPGGSPYLASLRMDQAKSWEKFRDACSYSNIPGENMVWAGVDGTIGWQAVGIVPVRKNFSGLVPVPGDGRYEWDGYLPIKEKPHLVNPDKGYFSSANQCNVPEDYQHWNAIGYSWSDDYRQNRLEQVLGQQKKFTINDMKVLQNDYYSIPASQLIPFLEQLTLSGTRERRARELLLGWNDVLDKTSVPAGIYNQWERQILKQAKEEFIPEEIRPFISLQMTKVVSWMTDPARIFGNNPERERNRFLKETFLTALDGLEDKLGPDLSTWQYGRYKHILIRHPLSAFVDSTWQAKLDAGPLPRGGGVYCPGVTGSGDNQTRGASFRIIVPAGDWDHAVAINTPGQSGNPESPYYKNLFNLWAEDGYFPLHYSKEKIRTTAAVQWYLKPQKNNPQ